MFIKNLSRIIYTIEVFIISCLFSLIKKYIIWLFSVIYILNE